MSAKRVGSVVLLLDHVKARDARFLDAVARVVDGRRSKSVHKFRFHMAKDMNNQHGRFLPTLRLL
jgi:hypothetical protein